MTNGNKAITISTSLIGAIAKWARREGDGDRYSTTSAITAVAFHAAGTITATDGHRCVVVPFDTCGLRDFGVDRCALLAAVAAQDALFRDEVPFDKGFSANRTLRLELEGDMVVIRASQGLAPRVEVRGTAWKLDNYPSTTKLFDGCDGDDSPSPDGYCMNAGYLAGVHEVTAALMREANPATRITKWTRIRDEWGTRGALIMENRKGARFVVMPMRDIE